MIPEIETCTVLHESEDLRIVDLICRRGRDIAAEEESTRCWEIVFVRSGAFSIEIGGRTFFTTPNQMLFLAPDRPYRISHPTSGGDECTVVAVAGDRMDEWTERLEVRWDAIDSLFENVTFSVGTPLFLSQQDLLLTLNDHRFDDAVMECLNLLIHRTLDEWQGPFLEHSRIRAHHRRIVRKIQERIAQISRDRHL